MTDKFIYNVEFDHREKSAELLGYLSEQDNVNLIRKTLRLGDYLLDDGILIERKSVNDFIDSLCSGRLFSQMYRLSQSEYKTALLLEGKNSDIQNCNVSREAILGAISSISLILDIPILRTSTQIESAKIIMYCAAQKRANVALLTRVGRKPKRFKTQQLHLIQALPNVGPKLAKRLLEYFGSLEGIFNAQCDQLVCVEGIGIKTATHIRHLITKKANS